MRLGPQSKGHPYGTPSPTHTIPPPVAKPGMQFKPGLQMRVQPCCSLRAPFAHSPWPVPAPKGEEEEASVMYKAPFSPHTGLQQGSSHSLVVPRRPLGSTAHYLTHHHPIPPGIQRPAEPCVGRQSWKDAAWLGKQMIFYI